MIRYALKCESGHEFESWFANSAAFETLARAGQLSCLICGGKRVTKAPMTPNVVTSRSAEKRRQSARPAEDQSARSHSPISALKTADPAVLEALRLIRRHVTANAEYVGPRFAEEARKIHYEEAPERGIYGEATPEEARALDEEGIVFHPLPVLPEDHN